MGQTVIIILLFTGILFLAGCGIGQADSGTIQAVNTLVPLEFAEAIADDSVFVIDAHVPEQQHIEGTDAFIPYDQIGQNAGKLPADKSVPIAVYCRSGSMSAEAAQILKRMGYTKIYYL